MDADDRGRLIGWSRQHPIELDTTQTSRNALGLLVAVRDGSVVVFGRSHLQVLFEVRDFSRQLLCQLELLLDIGAFAKRSLSLGLFVPEAWRERLLS
jgi:hypothetical protein